MKDTSLKILSLDGGGTRGLFPATILDCLQIDTGKKPAELFDMIVGSATGGIIAAALAAGLPTADIVDIYLNRADYILPQKFIRRLWNPLNLFAPKYPNDNLKKLLSDKFGNMTLGDAAGSNGNSPVFLIAALDMSPEIKEGEIPEFRVVVYSSADPDHARESLVDIALRSSAAVVNLPLYGTFTEGGNYANDPAMVGFSYALGTCRVDRTGKRGQPGISGHPGKGDHMGEGGHPEESYSTASGRQPVDLEDIRLLSLGCGSTGSSYIPADKIGRGNWGLIRWIKYLVNLVIETNMVATQHYLRQMLPDENYLRINAWYGAGDAPGILKNKKLKIDVTDKRQLAAIRTYAEKVYARHKPDIFRLLGC